LSVSGRTGWRWYAPVVGAFESDVDVFGQREASGPNPRLSVSVGERFLTDVHDADVGDAATRAARIRATRYAAAGHIAMAASLVGSSWDRERRVDRVSS